MRTCYLQTSQKVQTNNDSHRHPELQEPRRPPPPGNHVTVSRGGGRGGGVAGPSMAVLPQPPLHSGPGPRPSHRPPGLRLARDATDLRLFLPHFFGFVFSLAPTWRPGIKLRVLHEDVWRGREERDFFFFFFSFSFFCGRCQKCLRLLRLFSGVVLLGVDFERAELFFFFSFFQRRCLAW